MELTPQYPHDCELCQFLGSFTITEMGRTTQHDLYVCVYNEPLQPYARRYYLDTGWDGEQPIAATVIARYGEEGHEYQSGCSFAWPMETRDGITGNRMTYLGMPQLVEARKRAVARGIHVPKT